MCSSGRVRRRRGGRCRSSPTCARRWTSRTGTPPCTGDSPAAIAHRHVREAPRPPSAAQPGVGSEIDAIVLKALNKNPLNRYQTAAEMRSDLVRALSVQAVQAVNGRIIWLTLVALYG